MILASINNNNTHFVLILLFVILSSSGVGGTPYPSQGFDPADPKGSPLYYLRYAFLAD